jgi:signal transduction histidine kinase
VAGQWRIRHKLMLGLGLVVGVMAILLGGTVLGLLSYRETTKLMESRFNELRDLQAFKAEIQRLATGKVEGSPKGGGAEPDKQAERLFLLKQVEAATPLLATCRTHFQDSVDRGRYLEPEEAYTLSTIGALEQKLANLHSKLSADDIDDGEGMHIGPEANTSLRDKYHLEIAELVRDTSDWESRIHRDVWKIEKEARASYTQSFWILGTTSVLSVLLMAGLLGFFYNWVFHPVRDLMEGVGRVSQGNFEHAIEVKSGDEMQELAAAFNEMTRRLRDIYRSLAQQVNERSRQLVRSERLASVGFLAAGVAHEINNPLASIAFCSEALEARLAEILAAGRGMTGAGRTDSEVIFKYLKMIQEEAFRCKAITQKLLEFSRTGERRREPTDLGELVRSVLDVTQHLQNHKGKRIEFPQPAKVTAWVNAQEIKSVVLNLVVNALDSMEEGGTLTIGLRARDGMAELTFQDTGCGMTPEVLENIFEPFFTRSRTGKGTGLGLTISHRIVTGQGGEIEAKSPGPGGGSTFVVRLPSRGPAEDQGTVHKDDAEAGNPGLLFHGRHAA